MRPRRPVATACVSERLDLTSPNLSGRQQDIVIRKGCFETDVDLARLAANDDPFELSAASQFNGNRLFYLEIEFATKG